MIISKTSKAITMSKTGLYYYNYLYGDYPSQILGDPEHKVYINVVNWEPAQLLVSGFQVYTSNAK